MLNRLGLNVQFGDNPTVVLGAPPTGFVRNLLTKEGRRVTISQLPIASYIYVQTPQ
jgi:hypothetical protein